MKSSNRKGNGIGKKTPGEAERTHGPSPREPAKGGGVKKVAHLRSAVENGTYRVESRKVADRIVRDAVREIRDRLR